MQICYRCKEKTNQALEKMAKKNGVSKNHLMDEIIKEYLRHGIQNHQAFYPSLTESKLLPAIQYANELLAQLLEELNNTLIYVNSNTTPNTNIIIDNHVAAYTKSNANTHTNESVNIGNPESVKSTDEPAATNISAQHLSFSTFYIQSIYLLLEISETLEMIRKKANI